MQHTEDGEYTTKQIEDFHKNIHMEFSDWKKTVKNVYLPQGWPFPKCLWYHQHIMEKQHEQINDPSLWNNKTCEHENLYRQYIESGKSARSTGWEDPIIGTRGAKWNDPVEPNAPKNHEGENKNENKNEHYNHNNRGK